MSKVLIIASDTKDFIKVCYEKIAYKHELWTAENALVSSLPVFVMQLVSIMFVSRVLAIAFKPLRQPRIVAEILAGVILGPTVLGAQPLFLFNVFLFDSMLTLETVGNLALVYHMFLVGLELDLKPVKRSWKKAIFIALAGTVFAIPVGWALLRYLLFKDFNKQTNFNSNYKKFGPIFWGVTLATTNFPDIARILVDLKLLTSEVGQLALSAAVISDLCSWLILLVVMASFNRNPYLGLWPAFAFIALCVFVIRPVFSRLLHERENEDTNYDEYTCFVLAGVVLFGLITDACGSHSIVGPFVLGAILPRGELRKHLVRKLGNFVPLILMPLFYLITGLRINLHHMNHALVKETALEAETGTTQYRLAVVIIIAFAAKIVTTYVAGLIIKMSSRDSLALGVLMNTKGLLGLIVLGSARDLEALNKQTYCIMVVAIWIMTVAVGPFLALAYKSNLRVSAQYTQRNILSIGPNSELRILACTHTSRNAPSIINLLEASNPTKNSPIHVFALHLVELTGHSAAVLIVHESSKMNTNEVQSSYDSSTSNAFENYARQKESVTVQALTVVSAYATMHEDICNLAEQKRATLIIIPFHKQSTTDGATKDSNTHLRSLNGKLIAKSPCSLGVFVDRGFTISNLIIDSKSSYHDRDNNNHDDYSMGRNRHLLAMFFFGGADDREALAYAWRMAGHPKISLTVIWFKPCKKAIETSTYNYEDDDENDDDDDDDDDEILEAMASTGRQKQLDELYLDQFRIKSMNDPSIQFEEKAVTSWEETLTLINDMESDYDLYIIGRRHGNMSGTTILDCSGSDELGVLGDALESLSIERNTSILIVQQGALEESDAGEEM